MLNFLIRKFIKDYEQVHERGVRTSYGVLAGCLGIVLNLLLFALKLPLGLYMGSIAVLSDAFNNISDMGSSLIGVIGAKMAGRGPDRSHPFGHGRIEYISALAVAMIILLVGFELLKESVDKFFHPEPVALNAVLLTLLALSILVKLWMFLYNRRLGALINSPVMKATAKDSLNDVFTTSAVVLATLAGAFTAFPVDAVAGCAVSLLILYNGYETARDTVDLLLGGHSDPELMREIAGMVSEAPGVVGVHDLIVHDYGPGRAMASVHAEVPADGDILRIHEVIDEAEGRIYRELGVPIVIHMDPIVVNSARLDELKETVGRVLGEVNPAFSFHDFRMTDGENRINLIFDLVVPCEETVEARAAAVKEIGDKLREIDPRYRAVIKIDDGFAA